MKNKDSKKKWIFEWKLELLLIGIFTLVIIISILLLVLLSDNLALAGIITLGLMSVYMWVLLMTLTISKRISKDKNVKLNNRIKSLEDQLDSGGIAYEKK